MGRRTALAVGGATAVALALGGLVGGVLAESPSAGSSPSVPVALSERALAGTAGGVSVATVAALPDTELRFSLPVSSAAVTLYTLPIDLTP